MDKSVWMIEAGEYSDYHVVGVYSTRENAETVLAHVGDGRIREVALDLGVEEIRGGLRQYWVDGWRSGSPVRYDLYPPSPEMLLEPHASREWKKVVLSRLSETKAPGNVLDAPEESA